MLSNLLWPPLLFEIKQWSQNWPNHIRIQYNHGRTIFGIGIEWFEMAKFNLRCFFPGRPSNLLFVKRFAKLLFFGILVMLLAKVWN